CKMDGGGGILREFSIHYLDAMIQLLGMPNKVNFVSSYKTKFIDSDVADTVYVNLDFGNFGGSVEISIGAEPKNLECSLSIMSEFGYICLAGKSLNEIIETEFLEPTLNQKLQSYVDLATKNSVASLASTGASPYHPELYRQIAVNPEVFQLQETYNVIKLIEDIYSFV
ncbi:MAG: hypothetical protein K2P99_02530, partial [Burkholderiales bacterium]|nr:hypothetical protein [Burkholderiales bacterium]